MVTNDKISLEDYRKDQTAYTKTSRKLTDTVENCVLKQNNVVNYIEKFIPLRIQMMLSESLYASLENATLKKYVEHEEYTMKTMQSASIGLNNMTID